MNIKGGMLEWSLLSLIYEDFIVYDNKKNRPLNKEELSNNLVNNNHWIKDKKNTLLNNLPAQKKYTLKKNNLNNIGKLLKNKVCVVTGATSGLGLETLKCMLITVQNM